MAKSLINRRLFKVEYKAKSFKEEYIDKISQVISDHFSVNLQSAKQLIIQGEESNSVYITSKEEIMILFKDGKTMPMSEISDFGLQTRNITKHYLCYPKNIF